ncbi:MAG: hypothetical protein O0X93_06295, partial [Methanocorpusculum sp.]|nr:hypothetical protein [Methanocorpusculum sp.]
THIGQLCPKVVEGGYDLGIAFDGDADRIIAVDERGEVVAGPGAGPPQRGRARDAVLCAG